MHTEILCGDNLPILREMADNSVDAIVTDPPYGLSFMGKRWDYDVPSVELWAECLRVLKPGGHLLAFAGTRTQHRMAVRIEDAGFEIRDMIAWVYGSGFPKSLDVSKAIDKAAGVEREVVGLSMRHGGGAKVFENQGGTGFVTNGKTNLTAPATDAAHQWDGWGTALKPALEPITFARKPLAERTVAANVLEWGTGGVNVDGCRVGTDTIAQHRTPQKTWREREGRSDIPASADYSVTTTSGRFPANLIHDGSDEVVGLFPVTGPSKASQRGSFKIFEQGKGQWIGQSTERGHNDQGGSAARFFASFPQSKADVLDLLFCRAKAIMSAWNKDIANAAENSLHLSRHHVDSVLSDAVIVATHGGKLLSAWTGLSTGATPNELRIICEMLITAILSIENGQSLVLWQGERTPYNCLVSVAATQKQTDTMTITISLPKLDGSVESVTFNIMPALSAVGAADSVVRFKYCAKASRSEREAGLEGVEKRERQAYGDFQGTPEHAPKQNVQARNHHPTVKPIALMRYLCRLVTPPSGIVLDPFTGSGTTGCAATLEGFGFIGIEREAKYAEIARRRIEHWRDVASQDQTIIEDVQEKLFAEMV